MRNNIADIGVDELAIAEEFFEPTLRVLKAIAVTDYRNLEKYMGFMNVYCQALPEQRGGWG